MNDEIKAVLEELSQNRELNTKFGGQAVMQAAVIVELRKLREAVIASAPERKSHGVYTGPR